MAAKEYAKYTDIPSEYRWNLEDILEGQTYEELFDATVQAFKKLIEVKDSKYESIENYIQAMKYSEEYTLLSFRLNNYLSNNQNTNVVDPTWEEKSQQVSNTFARLSQELGSEENRMYQHVDKLNEWKHDPRLSLYERSIEDTIDSFKYKLSDEVEEYIIKKSRGNASPSTIFSILTNSELVFKDAVDSKGKKYTLNKANYSTLMKKNDKQLRKSAMENYADAYLDHKSTLSQTLYQQFKGLVVEAETRGYKSAVEMLTYDDRVPEESLLNLYEQVSSRVVPTFKKYREYTKKFYKAKYGEKMERWDSQRELVSVKSEYTVEEAKDLVTQALMPFGQEYIGQINKAMNEQWIDFMPAKGKRSGAYSIGGSYGLSKKYILMNFDGQLRSVETLAHELGHSMHSYYSDTRQPLVQSQYPIFLAEIASIFNELMLFDHLLKTSNDDKLKFYILQTMIDGFIGTVLRQVEWSNYEYNLYKAIQEDKPASSWQAISQLYYENANKYAIKPAKEKVDRHLIASIYVPHYYYHFYVYKYAVGQLAANYFFAQYKKHGTSALQDYINNFLSAGCSDYPLEILKSNGIDLNSEDFYKDGFDYVKELIDEWIELGKKIFKSKLK
ncbi:oligoendopeptidase F [Mycoplasma sp. Ms02]|uniref:oligoendopeptidase F n=1 Tax=Mycoplasma sp. Ms02 TaxID=353851 RepID=UPI001C8AFD52|nr:oligoendopeptidase F [Mycoplasma sp. Ms02]QZE12646.1 oligoendopeptidase F [Mycoplasma sp. Ms02]